MKDYHVKQIHVDIVTTPPEASLRRNYVAEVKAKTRTCPVCGKYNPSNIPLPSSFDREKPAPETFSCVYCGAVWEVTF